MGEIKLQENREVEKGFLEEGKSKVKGVGMVRRKFLQDLGIVGAFSLLKPLDVLAQIGEYLTEKELLAPEEIKKLEQALESYKTLVINELKELKESTKEAFDFWQRYEQKYGTIEEPKLDIESGYEFQQFEYEPPKISDTVKDREYYKSIARLYQLSTLIKGYKEKLTSLERESGEELITGSLTDIQSFIDRMPVEERTFIFTEEEKETGKEIFVEKKIEKAGDFVDFVSDIANHEISYTGSPITVLDDLKYNKLLRQFSQEFPEYIQKEADAEVVKGRFNPYLSKLLKGYPERWPELIIHQDKGAFLKDFGNSEESLAAFHRAFTDSVVTFRKESYRHLLELSHEYGHVISRSTEEKMFTELRKIQDWIKEDEDMLLNLDKALGALKEIRGKTQKEQEKLYNALMLLEVAIRLVLDTRAFSFLLGEGLEQNLKIFQGAERHAQLDESAAYLFQDIILNAIAQENRKLGEFLLKIRDFECWGIGSVEHYGSFRLAEELKIKHRGNAITALREIAYLNNPERIGEYQNIINSYNKKYQVKAPMFNAFLSAALQDDFYNIKKESEQEVSTKNSKEEIVESIKQYQRELITLYQGVYGTT